MILSVLQSDPQSAFQLFENYQAFVAMIVLSFAVIGLWGRSLMVGVFTAYLAFAHIALETETPLFEQIVYVTAVLIMVGMGFKIYRAELAGE